MSEGYLGMIYGINVMNTPNKHGSHKNIWLNHKLFMVPKTLSLCYMHVDRPISQIPQCTLDICPTMHHFVTEMCTHVHISVTKWCMEGYGTVALWDLWIGSIISMLSWFAEKMCCIEIVYFSIILLGYSLLTFPIKEDINPCWSSMAHILAPGDLSMAGLQGIVRVLSGHCQAFDRLHHLADISETIILVPYPLCMFCCNSF